MNKQEAIKELESLKMEGKNVRDGWYNGGLCEAITILNKLDEPQKPVLPRFVAEWLEKTKKDGDTPHVAICTANGEVGEWISDPEQAMANQEAFIRAWLDGYDVEREPLYRVIMPNPQSKNGNVLVLRKTQQGTITVDKVRENTAILGERMDLTEEEIESVDERYWAFAVPVEELEEENENRPH